MIVNNNNFQITYICKFQSPIVGHWLVTAYVLVRYFNRGGVWEV